MMHSFGLLFCCLPLLFGRIGGDALPLAAMPAWTTLPSWVSAAATIPSASTTVMLESIHQEYLRELEEGFRTFGTTLENVSFNEPILAWSDDDFRHSLVGIGNAGPDESVLTNGHAIYQTRRPVLSQDECATLIAEAQQVIQAGLMLDATMDSTPSGEAPPPTNSQLGEARVSQLPVARKWLQTVLHTRFFPLLSSRFGIAPSDMTLQDGLIIGYGHPLKLGSRSQPIHRDSCLISLNVALSPLTAYTEGGTFFEAVSDLPNQILFTEQGHATCHAGGISHAGRGIGPHGERWVLVLFCIVRNAPEYARRCHANGLAAVPRTADWFTAGLAEAPRDHLLWTSLGSVEKESRADVCLHMAAQSYAHCRQADLALGRRMLSRRRPRAALRRFDRVLEWLQDRDLSDGVWHSYRTLGWDARYYGAQAALLCAREARERRGLTAEVRHFVNIAMARCKVMLRAAPDDHRILGMIRFAEDLLNNSLSS